MQLTFFLEKKRWNKTSANYNGFRLLIRKLLLLFEFNPACCQRFKRNKIFIFKINMMIFCYLPSFSKKIEFLFLLNFFSSIKYSILDTLPFLLFLILIRHKKKNVYHLLRDIIFIIKKKIYGMHFLHLSLSLNSDVK